MARHHLVGGTNFKALLNYQAGMSFKHLLTQFLNEPLNRLVASTPDDIEPVPLDHFWAVDDEKPYKKFRMTPQSSLSTVREITVRLEA